MASFNITLNPPQICVRLADSQTGIIILEDNLKFGVVDYLNQNNLNLDVGDVILFDSTKATKITQGTTTYFITDENNFFFRENVTPTPP